MDSTPVFDAQDGFSGPWLRRFSISAISLVIANAGVLSIFLIYDVSLFQLVLVYWCECLWIGVFSAIKLIVASLVGDPYENRWAHVSPGSALFLSIIVIVSSSGAFFSLLGITLMSILFANDALQLSTASDQMHQHIGLVLGASLLLLASHGISLVANFLLLGEYKLARVGMLVALPFKRCAALFLMILISIVFVALVPAFANTFAFAAVIIVLKVFWDLGLHAIERRDFALLQQPGS